MSKPNNLDQILADERQFPEEMTPKRDLWPGIEKAISQHKQKPKSLLSVNQKIALSSAASICLAVLLIQFLAPLPGSGFNSGSDSNARHNTAGIDALVKTYETEKHQMLVRYQDQKALVDDWQPQLDELESAARSLRGALEEDPNNAVLIRMLGKIYQQQLDLINKVHAPQWQKI